MEQDGEIKAIESVHKTPIMFYRPNQPAGGNYLKVRLHCKHLDSHCPLMGASLC